jgi:hypothetical protein
MSLKTAKLTPLSNVPDSHCSVAPTRDREEAIRGEGYRLNRIQVAVETAQLGLGG